MVDFEGPMLPGVPQCSFRALPGPHQAGSSPGVLEAHVSIPYAGRRVQIGSGTGVPECGFPRIRRPHKQGLLRVIWKELDLWRFHWSETVTGSSE